jgi:uncharacterized metal-binding protein YceD (DUF177 family)
MKSDLIVQIHSIGDAGYEIDDFLDAAWIGFDDSDVGRYVTPVKVKGTLFRAGNSVIAKLTGVSRYATICYRSSVPVEKDVSVSMVLEFMLEPHQQTLNLAEDIRQEMILGVPMRVLSDAEMAKDGNDTVEEEAEDSFSQFVEDDIADKPQDTYRPFEGLNLNIDDHS